MAIRLSKRLTALANMVTDGNRLADIGTDHGYIPIYLCQTGKIPSALAMDIGKGPLQQAQTHIAEHGLSEQIKTRLSDGMAALQFGEADTILIAGMGGGLVMKILSEGAEKLTGKEELILQPQSELPAFRRFLRAEGYLTLDENILCEEGKYYFVFKVCYAPEVLEREPAENDLQRVLYEKYGRLLLQRRHPVLKEYLKHMSESAKQIEAGVRSGEGERTRSRLAEIRQELRDLDAALALFAENTLNG